MSDTRTAFEAFVLNYTGRDMAYHKRNRTAGLEFARDCWQAAYQAATERAAQELADWLEMAAADIEDWAGYASDYFQQKHDLAGTVAKYRERAAAIRGG